MPPGDYSLPVCTSETFPADREARGTQAGDAADFIAIWESAWIDLGGEG